MIVKRPRESFSRGRFRIRNTVPLDSGTVVLAFEILLVLVSVLIAWFGLYVLYRLFTES